MKRYMETVMKRFRINVKQAVLVAVTLCTLLLFVVRVHRTHLPDAPCTLDGYQFYNASRTLQYQVLKHENIPVINDIFNLFSIIHSPENACSDNTKKLLIFIKSAAHHVARRKVIRDTWGNSKKYQDMVVYFVLGYNEKFKNDIEKEVHVYGDLVQGSFIDVYRNLTYKSCLTYRWIHTHCSNVPHMLLVDDDQFVNTDLVLEFVSTLPKGNSTRKIYGAITRGWNPSRSDADSKGYVSEEDFPFHCYPDYAYGGAIITTPNVVEDISLAIPFTRRFPIDDAYIGIVAFLLNVELVHDPRITADFKSYEYLKNYLCVHSYKKDDQLIHAWNHFRD